MGKGYKKIITEDRFREIFKTVNKPILLKEFDGTGMSQGFVNDNPAEFEYVIIKDDLGKFHDIKIPKDKIEQHLNLLFHNFGTNSQYEKVPFDGNKQYGLSTDILRSSEADMVKQNFTEDTTPRFQGDPEPEYADRTASPPSAVAPQLANEANNDIQADEPPSDQPTIEPEEDNVGFSPVAQNMNSLEGGLGDEASPNDFCPVQLGKGVQVEMEHTNDPRQALEIAMDHLTEMPDYYDKLETMEGEPIASNPEDTSPEDSLLKPSEHWEEHYTAKNLGDDSMNIDDNELEEVAVDPEVGEDAYVEQQNVQQALEQEFDFDQKGNWIPRGFERNGFALRPVEKPMGSGNEVIHVIKFTSPREFEILHTSDNWDDAKARIFDMIQ